MHVLAVAVLAVVREAAAYYDAREELRVGGLFLTTEEDSVRAFRAAVDAVNEDDAVLPDHRLVGVEVMVPEFDALEAHKRVCDLLAVGVAVVLGPSSAVPATHVRAVLDAVDVPHLDVRAGGEGRGLMQVHLHPATETLTQMLPDVVATMAWPSITVVYYDSGALPRLAGLLKAHGAVALRQLPPGEDYRHMFKELKQSGETVFLVDCPVERLHEVLVQLQQCGLLVAPYSFFFTNLDFSTLDLSPFQYGGANITGIRLVSAAEPPAGLHDGDLDEDGDVLADAKAGLRLQAALFHDGVVLAARALHQVVHHSLAARPLSCEAADSWEHGASLFNFIRTSEVQGLSGLLRFDHQGRRSSVLLELLELAEDGPRGVGLWNTTQGLNVASAAAAPAPDCFHTCRHKHNPVFFNKTLTVLLAMTPPYSMLKENSMKLTGNAQYEGFGVELIDELARLLGFNYTFVVQEDGEYGTCEQDTGRCTGMMAEVKEGRVDLAIVDLTITSDRESHVDFTTPFLSLGIQVLYRKPTRLPPSLMSFLSPFSGEVWLLMTAAYTAVSLLIFVMARISPYEWNNPYPCVQQPERLENQFSLRNSFWFTIGSIMQQGSEIAPIAASTRMAASIWWFFTLIMVSSYTANLAAFLTVTTQHKRISSVEDLAAQSYIKYGAKRRGSTLTFFEETENPVYAQMYARMMQWDREGLDVLQDGNEAGMDKVAASDDYAFLMESVAIEYMTERNCNVTSVGARLDEKGYGIAMAKNAPYRSELSAGVLQMQETGRMMEMKDKWWKNKRGGGACIDPKKNEVSGLDMDNVSGVFLVLVSGCVLAVVVAVAELALSVYRTAAKQQVPFRREFLEEVRFLREWSGSAKPVRHPRGAPGKLKEAVTRHGE